MKIHVLSDVHFEHKRQPDIDHFYEELEKVQKSDPADVCVLAGDICTVAVGNGRLWKTHMARLCSGYGKVFYVPGNHEYYGSDFDEVAQFFMDQDGDPNFHNLVNLDRENKPYEYNGLKFLGGTMWFADKHFPRYQKDCLMDFNAIRKFEPEVYQLHRRFLKKLNNHYADIVVTHHTPLPASIDAQWRDSDINDFFMSDRTNDLKEESLPKGWIHGHTHNAFDYVHQVGQASMRVYCNPQGYPHEGQNSRFWNKVAIDV